MSEIHAIGALSAKLEAVDPRFVHAGLLQAREKSWKAFHEIRSQLKVGMTETQGRELALRTLFQLGAKKQWHNPYVRFGPGTALTFYDPLQKEYRLQDGDAVYLDLGPVWNEPDRDLEYEGDVGDTFVFGANPEVEKCIEVSHQLWHEAQEQWRTNHSSGEELYRFLGSRAQAEGYLLVEKITGHRLSDYPHVKYSKERLSKLSFKPNPALWILEFQIKDPGGRFGVFYEDLLQ